MGTIYRDNLDILKRDVKSPSGTPQAWHLCRNQKLKNISKLRQERHLPQMANTYTQIYIHIVLSTAQLSKSSRFNLTLCHIV
jgi:hypothetical protein